MSLLYFVIPQKFIKPQHLFELLDINKLKVDSATSRLQSTPATPVEYTNKAEDVSYARDMTDLSAKRLAADKHVRAPSVSLGEKILVQYCRLNLK